MENKPTTPDLIALVRNADPQSIRQRLDELNGEEAALKTLLRSIEARQRARRPVLNVEGHR
jgi:ribosomal 50S subunit-associated protein YjgA (DUF615 family)